MTAHESGTKPVPRPRRRLALKIALGIAGAAFLLLLVLAVVLLVLTSRDPNWWSPPDPADPATRATAQAVENGVTTLLHQARPAGGPSESWTVRLTEREVNAWLSARLGGWLASRTDMNAGDIPPVQVSVAADGMRVGIGLAGGRVLSAALATEVSHDGALWARLGSCAIGELAVPLPWVLRAVREAGAGDGAVRSTEADRLVEVFSGRRALAGDPVVRLSDGRRVRLLGLHLAAGEFLVTCRTLEP